MDIVTDLELKMADDVATPTDHATVADTDHRVGDHALARHHAGRDADMGTDQGVVPDGDPPLAEQRPGREGQAAS
jgi:hypothetical protein